MGRRWSASIGSVGGTQVRIHFTFLLLLLWFAIAGWISAGPTAAISTVTFIVLLFLCVVLHEFGHIFAARQFGVHTPEIVLLPIGGVSRLERIPEEPRAEFLIALAGPAVTLVIALGLIALLGGLPPPETLTKIEGPRALLAQLAYANVVLFVFNLVPAFPMDGGRVLRAGLAAWFGHTRGTTIAAGVGQAVAVLLGVAGIFSGNIILVLVAVFVFLAAGSERGVVEMRGITSGRPASESMITRFVPLAPGEPVSRAATELIRTEQREFPVIDGNGRLRGMLMREGIIRALVEGGPDTPIERVMESDIPTVSRWTRMDDIVPLLVGGAKAVGVTGDDGRCVGFITWDNLMEEVAINKALDRQPASGGAGRSPWGGS
jgi:stage IV sporulation protein FB